MLEVPPLTSKLWQMLVTGKITHKFSLFAANMAVARAVRLVQGDPLQTAAMTAELHQFFGKYASSTAAELQKLI